jgi:hypothetical protein
MATTIEDALLAASIPADPDAAEFAGIRADLGRLFIRHKADMGLGDWSDADIVANTNRIAGAIMAAGCVALDRNDTDWLARHKWFSDAAERIFADGQAVPMDG